MARGQLSELGKLLLIAALILTVIMILVFVLLPILSKAAERGFP